MRRKAFEVTPEIAYEDALKDQNSAVAKAATALLAYEGAKNDALIVARDVARAEAYVVYTKAIAPSAATLNAANDVYVSALCAANTVFVDAGGVDAY